MPPFSKSICNSESFLIPQNESTKLYNTHISHKARPVLLNASILPCHFTYHSTCTTGPSNHLNHSILHRNLLSSSRNWFHMMANPTSLLNLPAEVREIVWFFAAGAGKCEGLLQTCRQVRGESLSHFTIPDEIFELQSLRIWVEPSYVDGGWLELEYSWNLGGLPYHTTKVVKDMDDPVVLRLKKIKKVSQVVIILEAPKRGYFLAAFLMMLVKCNDAYRLIEAMSDGPRFYGSLTLWFSTEGTNSTTTPTGSKPFWECRSPEMVNDVERRNFYSGPTPFYYEYFLVNNPISFANTPKIKFNIFPRPHISSLRTYKGHASSRGLVFNMQGHGVKQYHPLDRLSDATSPRNIIADVSAGLMTYRRYYDFDLTSAPLARHVWEAISADFSMVNTSLQFLIDTLIGPTGGALDMLRLHRFKTMDGSEENYFAQAHSVGLTRRYGLLGAIAEVNCRMRTLFNPLAPYSTRYYRSLCEHLAQVEWSENMLRPSEMKQTCPPEAWLKFYPNGISYRYRSIRFWCRSDSLISWRYQNRRRLRETWFRSGHKAWQALHQWWDCMACCRRANSTWDALSTPVERHVIDEWESIFTESQHNPETGSWCDCSTCKGGAGTTVVIRRESYMTYNHYRNTQLYTTDLLSCLRRQQDSWGYGSDYWRHDSTCGRRCWVCRDGSI